MIVRPAGRSDAVPVIRLLRAFHAESGLPFPFDAAYAERAFLTHLLDEAACCFIAGERPVGVLMARAFDHPFGWGRWAKESFWFVAEEHRGAAAIRLLSAYEAWAREQGCAVAGMAMLAGHDISRIYERRGYRAVETNFVKAL